MLRFTLPLAVAMCVLGCDPELASISVTDVSVSVSGRTSLCALRIQPHDAEWLDPDDPALAPQRRTLESLATETFTAYAESIRRAVTAVPAQGRGEAAGCLLIDPDPTEILAPNMAPRGRAVYEPWARSIAAAEELASPPPAPPLEEQPGIFVNSNVVSSALAFLARLTQDPTAFADDQTRLATTHRLIAADGPLLRIVRVDDYVAPVVQPTGEHSFGFEPGSVRATVFVVDRERGQLLCASEISAVNRSQMSIRTEPGTATSTEDATAEVRGDLHTQLLAQIERVHSDAHLGDQP